MVKYELPLMNWELHLVTPCKKPMGLWHCERVTQTKQHRSASSSTRLHSTKHSLLVESRLNVERSLVKSDAPVFWPPNPILAC